MVNKTVLSLFSGCGGMDLGFEGNFDIIEPAFNEAIHPSWKAGASKRGWVRLRPTIFRTIFANDISTVARAAWVPYFNKRGNAFSVFHLGSIVDLVKEYENGSRTLLPKKVDVVTGGFPCQDFSVAGKRGGFSSHKNHNGVVISEVDEPTIENRGMLYYWMRKVIEIVKPKVFIAENVKGLINLEDAKTVIEKDFRSMGDGGYLVVDARSISAANYGVPQNRERIFFFGFRKSALQTIARNNLMKDPIPQDYDPYPPITHTMRHSPKFNDVISSTLPAVTVRQAIGDLNEPEDEEKDPSQATYSKARWYGRHCQGQTEVNLDSLGPTIRAEHHGNIEFRRLSKEHGGRIINELEAGLKERRLTIRECARLQSFPDDYDFIRNKVAKDSEFPISASDAYKLIGNAVPPLLSYHIACRLQELWPKLFKEA